MHSRAIVAASDIDNGAVADGKWSARVERQRGLHRPGGNQLFVVIDRAAWGLVSARGNDAGVIHRSPVEPQPVHVHGRPTAPTVGNWIVDLRGGSSGGKSSSVEVEFPLVNGAARPCYWRGHHRPGGPHVCRDIIDVQRVQF